MSLQWSIIALFLYIEVAITILLLLPIISATRWQKFFRSKFLISLSAQAHIYFYGFLVVLVLFFIDSIREMKRYSFDREHDSEHGHLDFELQHSMKLFRAQRNFYISGFTLFLYLVIRRLVLLISNSATLIADKQASISQAQSANQLAKTLMEENSKSKKGKGDEPSNDANNVEKLKNQVTELKESTERYKRDLETVKSQAKSVSSEYDRLLKEYEVLEKKHKQLVNASSNKKDD